METANYAPHGLWTRNYQDMAYYQGQLIWGTEP
jgi:hypothetical protein